MFYSTIKIADICLMANNNYFYGETVYFATKHGKESILSDLLFEHGLTCKSVPIDTDLFGTFSGEVERTGTIRENLRKKIKSAAERLPDAQLFLASEGSFGPHPIMGFKQTDLESLLLWHRSIDVEIYAEYLCEKPIHLERVLGPSDDFRAFLKENHFPEHAIIVRPEHLMHPLFKGLCHEYEVAQAMIDCFSASLNGRVVLATDLRANFNQTRRSAIYQAGLQLISKLQSTCPKCEFPGFAIERGVPGLTCIECGHSSLAAKATLWACVRCEHTEVRPRPDGKLNLDPSECEFCNP